MHINAEDRKYVVGTTIDIVSGGISGGQNLVGSGLRSGTTRSGSLFYEFYPQVQLRTMGAHSTLELSYAFGLSRLNNDLFYDRNSHGIAANFSSSLGPKWKLNLVDSFQLSSNFSTFNSTRGVVSIPNTFVFNPAVNNTDTQTNNVSISADYSLNEVSTLSLSGSHSLVKYRNFAAFQELLSDQQRVSESITYSHKLTDRAGWRLAYTAAHTEFGGQFDNANSHALSVGYFHQLGRDLKLELTAGPAYVQTSASFGSYTGYNSQVNLQKPVKANTLSLYYMHESGSSTGLGSISDNERAGFGVNRPVGKNASFFADISAFDVRGRLGAAYSTRGVSAAASLGIPLGRLFSLRWGGQYQRYDQTSIFGFEQKRIYVSLRFSSPELWKLSR